MSRHENYEYSLCRFLNRSSMRQTHGKCNIINIYGKTTTNYISLKKGNKKKYLKMMFKYSGKDIILYKA